MCLWATYSTMSAEKLPKREKQDGLSKAAKHTLLSTAFQVPQYCSCVEAIVPRCCPTQSHVIIVITAAFQMGNLKLKKENWLSQNQDLQKLQCCLAVTLQSNVLETHLPENSDALALGMDQDPAMADRCFLRRIEC